MFVHEKVLSDISSNQYTIKIAGSESEVEAALKLRYKVFIDELHRKFHHEERKDIDSYDDQAHHLIVVENESGEIVGTYRLQTHEMAKKGNGFASSKRFKVDQFPDSVLDNAVEVGRACISKEHRHGRVLYLLWKGFADYLTNFNKRYLFGYTAFSTKNPSVMWNTYNHLKNTDSLCPVYDLEVRDEYKFEKHVNSDASGEIDIPSLFQNYLDVGCKVCSKPSFDKELQLGHCMILLDIENIPDRTRKLFFGS